MKPDPNNHRESGGDGRSECSSSLRIRIAELERKIRAEKERSDLLQSESELAKLFARQESERYRRECSSLRERVGRLEEDSKILREREAVDRERIKGLIQDLESKDGELQEKLVEFKVAIRDLECAKRRAQEEARDWMVKCRDLLARESKLVDEIARLEEKGNDSRANSKIVIIDIDDEELPGNTSVVDSNRGNFGEELSKSKRKDVEVVDDDDDDDDDDDEKDDSDEDSIPLTLLREKRLILGKQRRPADSVLPASKARKVTDAQHQSFHKRCSKKQTSERAYTGRTASSEQLLHALRRAETLQSKLKSSHPSFIKTMKLSHVFGSFWVSLPPKFCTKNLPAVKTTLILEDEEGLDYKVIWIGEKFALSGGWGGFALAHNLEIGDALLFELVEPQKLKVYIIKANVEPSEDCVENPAVGAAPPTRSATLEKLNMQDLDLSMPSKLT